MSLRRLSSLITLKRSIRSTKSRDIHTRCVREVLGLLRVVYQYEIVIVGQKMTQEVQKTML